MLNFYSIQYLYVVISKNLLGKVNKISFYVISHENLEFLPLEIIHAQSLIEKTLKKSLHKLE